MDITRHILPVLLLACAAAAGPAPAAELVTIPLDVPEGGLSLLAAAEPGWLAFAAERPLADIAGVTLHVTGQHDCAVTTCWYGGTPGTDTRSYFEMPGFDTRIIVAETTELGDVQVIIAETPEECAPGAFDVEVSLPADDWSALEAGAGVLWLRGWACGHNLPYPWSCDCHSTSRVDTAELKIVLGEGVADQTESWGAVKARYR